MKYLTDYIQDAQTELFNSNGAFFAFSDSQFQESFVDGTKYTNCGMGLFCPSENVNTLVSGLARIAAEGIAQDIAENGKDAIIDRELGNHEAYYTMDTTSTILALAGYGFTEVEINDRLIRTLVAVD